MTRSAAIGALRRWLAVQLLVLLFPAPASAVPVAHDSRVCHAVSPLSAPDAALDQLSFTCSTVAGGYNRGSLWLRLAPQLYATGGEALTLLVHQTRFDRLSVAFRYADGTTEWQQVHSGAFEDHWRPGAQIAFTPNDRSAPLQSIALRIDGLTSYQLLRLRIVSAGEADIENGLLSALIGAALTLLVAGALYNFSLALGIRRQYLAWQGAWAVCVFFWGTIWSQFGLILAPGMAGTLAAQSCTALSALSVLLATLSTTTALGRGTVPRPIRALALLFGSAVALIDIDRFKTINDEHGHDAGDVVLCTIATRLARWEGPRCAVARLGGEEFAMVVTHRSGAALTAFAEHVRQEIGACNHSATTGDRRVTVSVGVAEASKPCDFALLYRDADRALYAAKRSGRDRVCRIEDPAIEIAPPQGTGPAAAETRVQRVG